MRVRTTVKVEVEVPVLITFKEDEDGPYDCRASLDCDSSNMEAVEGILEWAETACGRLTSGDLEDKVADARLPGGRRR